MILAKENNSLTESTPLFNHDRFTLERAITAEYPSMVQDTTLFLSVVQHKS